MSLHNSTTGVMTSKNTVVKGTSSEKNSAQIFERVRNQSQHTAPFCDERTVRPTQDQISTRAYELYVASNKAKGHCKENWARAEKELRDEPGASSPMKS
jgi:hypothetical protein